MDDRVVLPAHDELATELVEWFEDVESGGTSQLLWVAVDPDWGVEYAVAEVHRRLAAGQDPNEPFWSQNLAEDAILPRHGTTTQERSALPAYFEFVLDCSPVADGAADAGVRGFCDQVSQLADELAAVQRPTVGDDAQRAAGARAVGLLVTLGGAVGLAGPLGLIGTAATFADIGLTGFSFWRRRGDAAAIAAAETVAQVAHQVPVVVWVLNAESATSETMTVLAEICDGGGRLLVVAIANSRDRRSAMWRTFSERFDRRHRVGTVGCSHAVATQACDGASDLAAQVRGVLPEASEPVLAEIVGSVDSFSALRRLLGTPRLRDPDVTADDVRTAAMARQRDSVPTDETRRRLLAAAATLGPSFLAVTLSMAEVATAEEVDALAGVDGLGRWVAPVASGWYRFTSQGAHAAAIDLAEATLSRRDRAALGDAALHVLERARMGDDPGRLLVAAASLHAVGGQGDAAHGDWPRSDETAALWAAAIRLSEFGRWSGAARVGGWCEASSSERRSLVAYWRSLGGAEGGPSDSGSVDPAVRIGAGLARLAAMSASSAGTSTAAARAIEEVAGALAEIGTEVDGKLLADWQLALAEVLVSFGEGERAADLLDRVRPVSVRQRVILDDLGEALEHSYVGLHRRISLLTTVLDELCSDNRGTETEIDLRRELGRLQHQDGCYAEAVAERRQLADWVESAVGERHPVTLTARANLAASLGALGDAAGAAELQRQVLADLVEVLGERHPDTLTARANLAESLRALGDAAGAAELQRQVLADRVVVLGERHPDTLRARANLAASLWALGDAAGAAELQRQVLADRVVVLGERHPGTLTARANLAASLWELGDAAGAAELERQVLADRVVVLGERHPGTLRSMNNLACCLWDIGERGEAVELMRAAVEGQEVVLPDHPDTASSRVVLEGWLAEM